MTGYNFQEIVGMSFSDLTHPEDRQQTQQQFVRLLSGESPEYDVEKRYVRKDGETIWVHVWAGLVRDATGRPLRIAGIVQEDYRSQTGRGSVQAALSSAERAKAAAEQANRAKDHFLAVLSHELRNPLMPVVMGVSMLQEKPDLDPTTRETLEMIRRNAEMEARLIDDLLDVTRISKGKIELQKQPVELCAVIQRAVEVCQPDIEAGGLHFGVDIGPAAPYLGRSGHTPAPAGLLESAEERDQVHATRRMCRYSLPAKRDARHRRGQRQRYRHRAGGDPASLQRVRAAQTLDHQAVRRSGLVASRSARHWYNSTAARSPFTAKAATKEQASAWELPLAAPAGQAERLGPTAPRRAVRPLHILLVEDHAVTAKLIGMVLTAEGHTVETAGDAAQAESWRGKVVSIC